MDYAIDAAIQFGVVGFKASVVALIKVILATTFNALPALLL